MLECEFVHTPESVNMLHMPGALWACKPGAHTIPQRMALPPPTAEALAHRVHGGGWRLCAGQYAGRGAL